MRQRVGTEPSSWPSCLAPIGATIRTVAALLRNGVAAMATAMIAPRAQDRRLAAEHVWTSRPADQSAGRRSRGLRPTTGIDRGDQHQQRSVERRHRPRACGGRPRHHRPPPRRRRRWRPGTTLKATRTMAAARITAGARQGVADAAQPHLPLRRQQHVFSRACSPPAAPRTALPRRRAKAVRGSSR